MKVVAISATRGYKKFFLVEASEEELRELGSFSPDKPSEFTINMEINISATVARLKALKNISVGTSYDSALKKAQEAVDALKSLEDPLVEVKNDIAAIVLP